MKMNVGYSEFLTKHKQKRPYNNSDSANTAKLNCYCYQFIL